MGYWTFATQNAADAALAEIAALTGDSWDTAVRLRDRRWAFAAPADLPTPAGADLIAGLAAMLAGVPVRGRAA